MMHSIKYFFFRKKLGVFSTFFSSIIIIMLGLILIYLASESNAISQSLSVAGALEKKEFLMSF